MRNILISLFLLLCSVASAQTTDTYKKLRGPYLTNRFGENWSIGFSSAVNLYHGEDDNAGAFLKRLSPSVELYASKWITPIYGFRFNGAVGQFSGWSKELSHYSVRRESNLYYEKFNMLSARLDILINLSTVIDGYNEKRRWNFIPYFGAGGAKSSGGVDINREFTLSLGFLNNIYLSRNFDLTLDLRHTFINGRFDEVTTHMRLYEGFSTVSLGLAYKFGKFKKGQHNSSTWKDYSLYIRQTDSLLIHRKKLLEDNDTLKHRVKALEARSLSLSINNCVSDTVFVPDTIWVDNDHCVTSPLVLFFKINDWQLDSKGRTNLDLFVKYVINADSDRKFRLIGSADIDTGNRLINLRLSEKRVETVYNILVHEYNISENRLIRRPEGDTNNSFSEPLLNRAVIIR